MTTPDYAALATDYINRPKDGLLDHLRAYHEENKREETFELLLNLPELGKIEDSQECMFWFNADDGALVINELLEEAIKVLGITNHWHWDDPGTLYRSDAAADQAWETPAGQVQMETEAVAILECATGIYDEFRKQLDRPTLESAVEAAVLEQQREAYERKRRNAARKAAEANVPHIDQAAVERILGITRQGFMQDRLRTLPGATDGPDVLYASPDNLSGGTVQDLAQGMQALLRAGNYAVAPVAGRFLGQAPSIYIKYVPGKPPRAEHQLASQEAIIAVIEERMSEREWLDYLTSLGL